ncbi:MAG: hypothetical protein MJZ83_09630 [Bacteroidaceae bacterium]|nr:hypothetical protein [Bacteroidaceae bacterium]
MKKNLNLCVDLKTILQEDDLLTEGQCYRGCLTRNADDLFLFEEETHTNGHRHRRNPKLYEGRYVSLVHMQNGKYQVHMRTIDATSCEDRKDLAFKVYNELIHAFNIID